MLVTKKELQEQVLQLTIDNLLLESNVKFLKDFTKGYHWQTHVDLNKNIIYFATENNYNVFIVVDTVYQIGSDIDMLKFRVYTVWQNRIDNDYDNDVLIDIYRELNSKETRVTEMRVTKIKFVHADNLYFSEYNEKLFEQIVHYCKYMWFKTIEVEFEDSRYRNKTKEDLVEFYKRLGFTIYNDNKAVITFDECMKIYGTERDKEKRIGKKKVYIDKIDKYNYRFQGYTIVPREEE